MCRPSSSSASKQAHPRVLVRLGHKVDVVLQDLGVQAGGLQEDAGVGEGAGENQSLRLP